MSKAIGRTCKQLLSTLGNENRNEWHFENGLTVIAEGDFPVDGRYIFYHNGAEVPHEIIDDGTEMGCSTSKCDTANDAAIIVSVLVKRFAK